MTNILNYAQTCEHFHQLKTTAGLWQALQVKWHAAPSSESCWVTAVLQCSPLGASTVSVHTQFHVWNSTTRPRLCRKIFPTVWDATNAFYVIWVTVTTTPSNNKSFLYFICNHFPVGSLSLCLSYIRTTVTSVKRYAHCPVFHDQQQNSPHFPAH